MDPRIVSADTKFGFSLFSQILKTDADKNVFVSPASVAMALAMTDNGASGDTQQAMARVLELQGLSLEDVNRANAALKAALENPDPKVQLLIANSIWARTGVPFKPDFIARNKEFYGAEVRELDFRAADAASTINEWVSKNTKGKITEIVKGPLDDLMVLYLINAVYFKGEWTTAFEKAQTTEREFTLLDGSKKKHPMMSQSGNYRYYKGGDFQAVSLPYGSSRVSMYIFLPAKESSLKAFCRNLNAQNWEDWIAKFKSTDGDILLPKFKLEYEILLNDALKALGMERAFDPQRADFRAMTTVPVCISEVKHKTFVEVNEEGTEAAAVTSVGMRATSVMPTPKERFTMVVDRPFFCAIRDNQTGTVLFMGTIVEPK